MATKQQTITKTHFGGANFKLLRRAFFCVTRGLQLPKRENFMYEAGSEQINCNGAVIALPSLEVVKTGKLGVCSLAKRLPNLLPFPR